MIKIIALPVIEDNLNKSIKFRIKIRMQMFRHLILIIKIKSKTKMKWKTIKLPKQIKTIIKIMWPWFRMETGSSHCLILPIFRWIICSSNSSRYKEWTWSKAPMLLQISMDNWCLQIAWPALQPIRITSCHTFRTWLHKTKLAVKILMACQWTECQKIRSVAKCQQPIKLASCKPMIFDRATTKSVSLNYRLPIQIHIDRCQMAFKFKTMHFWFQIKIILPYKIKM